MGGTAPWTIAPGDAPAGADSRGGDGGGDGGKGKVLMALVYFPSSRCFAKAWSDPALVGGAYPLRAPLLAAGFEHIWLRCGRDDQ